jgi:hypothetical protein
MSLGCGTADGATDIAGQRAVLAAWRDSERTGDCPLRRRRNWVMGVSGSDAPVLDGLITLIFSTSHRAEGHQGFTSTWFIVSGLSCMGFSLVSSS